VTSTFSTKVLLLGLVALAIVGVVDAVIGGVWDHVALFAMGAVLAAVLLLRTNLRRRTVSLRADHARWLVTRAQLTGEDVGHLTDRAIATYRSALVPDIPTAGGARELARPAR